MPVVFSPGEAETRPLNPESIVYTTAQKVADLIGIGPGEAVLVGADTTLVGTTATFYVTGSDYREHGFSVGDSIIVYSDADPLGIDKTDDTALTITAITSSASGVGLEVDITLVTGFGITG
mgnify:CR=1 FL=1